MEGRYGMYSKGSSGWTSLRNEEFQEDDVWSVLKETKKDSNSNSNSNSNSKKSSVFASRVIPSASKMIPRSSKIPTNEPKLVHQSAPINVPDWSKIYGNSSKKASWYDDDDDDDGHVVMRVGGGLDSEEEEDDDHGDDDDDDGNMMPPHEWIAKKYARSQISSFSVCEGIGRTLKGRDLSRVRNAILTRTGFLE